MTTRGSTPHLDDGALVRLLDGEADPGDDRLHVEGCERCAHRLQVLRRRSDSLSALLARVPAGAPPADLWERVREAAPGAGSDEGPRDPAADPPAEAAPGSARPRGATWRSAPLLRAAAVAALLLGGALTAEPVREWIGGALRDLAIAAGVVDAPAPAPEAGAEVEVGITPRGDRVILRFDAVPPNGSVRIRFEDRTDAVGRAPGADAGADLVALPDGFRVRGPVEAGAVRFAVPAGLVVEVRFPRSEPVEVTGAAGEERRLPE